MRDLYCLNKIEIVYTDLNRNPHEAGFFMPEKRELLELISKLKLKNTVETTMKSLLNTINLKNRATWLSWWHWLIASGLCCGSQ